MKQHKPLLASLALSALLLSGCAAAAGSVSAPETPLAAPRTAQTGEEHTGSHGGGHRGAALAPGPAQADGPSEAALMVCGDQPMDRLTSILDLDTNPHTVNGWADSTFTCTYHLAEGDLEISVKETTSQAAARTYFDAMQALAKDAKTIEGLANLGFPAYETPDGAAVFHKDNFVLNVDATDLPATLGPHNITRNALAYQLSTTILACWIKHP